MLLLYYAISSSSSLSYLFVLLLVIIVLVVVVVVHPVAILHLEEWLSVRHAELGDHRTRGENNTVELYIVAVSPLKDPPVLEAAVEGLVTRPCRRLHPEIPLPGCSGT